MISAAPVNAVELARHPSDADPDVLRQTHRGNTSDLRKKSEIAGSSTGEAEDTWKNVTEQQHPAVVHRLAVR